MVEDDHVENDILERIQVTGISSPGKTMEYRFATIRTLDGASEWFLKSATGRAIFLVLIVMVSLYFRK